MQRQILPSESIDYALETYLPKVQVKSQLIYSIILLSVIGALVALPFIYMDISVQSPGVIRALSEKTELKSLVSGRISSANVIENQMVKVGDTLFTIDSDELDTKMSLSAFDGQETGQMIADLHKLVRDTGRNLSDNHRLSTGLYAEQLNLLRSQVQENTFAQQKIQNELTSDRKLYEERIISKRELDNKEYELNKLKAEYASLL